MPSRTTHRAESKYNVTTEFPHLGLHSAAANGNIGLVKYALSHGQPINSVLDGVLPLHAASSGGSDLVVKLLIEQGADVNASRLPRRYSDRHRDTSAPIVGSSGSTPLHFAAANGHTNVVRTLLSHGAHADRADKHGVTPEMLARENGKESTADLLKEWLENRDRDLRERGAEVGSAGGSMSADRRTSYIGPLDSLERKRLHVKHSIDQALNTLKSHTHPADTHSHPLADIPSKRHPSSPGESTSPFGEYTFYPTADIDPNDESSSRRPSLPHIYDDLPVPSGSKRPRSAGQDAELEPPRAPSGQRKLGSKYSLLNLFRKAGDTPNAGGHSTPESPYNASSTPSTPSASPSPAPGIIPLPSSPRFNLAHLSPSSPPESSPLANRHRPRMASDTSLGSAGPSATDLHDSLAEHVRNRSGSGSRRAFDEDTGAEGSGLHTPPSRPGILLRNHHHRASSSSQSQIQGAAFRALRFDSSSSTSSLSAKARNGVIRVFGLERSLSPPRVMQKSSSASSLIEESETGKERDERLLLLPSPPTTVDLEDAAVDADEEEYGEVIDRPEGVGKSRLTELKTEGRPRGSSFASSSSSLSPNMSPDSAIVSTAQEFPFSIDYPPPTDVLDEQLLTVPYSSSPPQGASDNRLRGNSISSMSTDGSANPQLSWSTTTATSSAGSGSMTTPASSNITLPGPGISSPRSIPRDIPGVIQDDKDPSGDAHPDQPSSFGLRRSHIPTDIDIRSISSHAQAEALVQRAQQSILEMDDIPDDSLLSSGRSPLSAKLAAYGESLALERRLKRVEEGMTGEDSLSAEESEVPPLAVFTRDAGRRTTSPRIRDMRALEGSKSTNPSRSRIRQPRRPNTSDSTSSTRSSFLFTNERARGYHQPSHSASIVGAYPQSTEDVTIIGHSPTPQPSLLSPHSPPQHSTNLPPLNRSRTPDPASDDLTIVDHVPLSRCITAPAAETFADVLVANGKHDSATRLTTSASKLTRMAFSSKDGSQPAGPISMSPRGHEQKSRFGIKSLFKGKS